LRVVRPLVRACGADLEEWVGAWKAVSLHEFEKANPPVLPKGLMPLTEPDQDIIVRPLERPAR
jgi:hypothetical protein